MRHLGAGWGLPSPPVLPSENYSGQVNAKEDTGVQYGLANTGRKLLQPAQRGTGRQLPLQGQRAWASRVVHLFQLSSSFSGSGSQCLPFPPHTPSTGRFRTSATPTYPSASCHHPLLCPLTSFKAKKKNVAISPSCLILFLF